MYFRPSAERGRGKFSWLDSYHSFSFGSYVDRNHVHFGPLRVINEDIVAAGGGFDTHGHADMEIITYVLSGTLEHKDNLGSGGVIRPGDVQVMTAGRGILHSEFNPSDTDPVHLLQIWILPREKGTKASYGQKTFAPEAFDNRLCQIVSADGAEGSLVIGQDARIWASKLGEGRGLNLPRDVNKKYWIQVARGTLDAGSQTLNAGDGLGLEGTAENLSFHAKGDAEFLVFELPV
jgi:redox-sensitive bicupin YhaK (pirin superfamily)